MLAFWDTFAGLVPVKVLSVEGKGNANTALPTLDDATIRFKFTATRGPYERGKGGAAETLR